MNIIIIGFMGTGKTSVGKLLAKRLGWHFVDVDKLIEASAGMSIAELFARRSARPPGPPVARAGAGGGRGRRAGEPVFRRLERRHIGQVVRGRHQVIATGGGAFVDARNRARLRATGCVVCLTAKPRTILARIGRLIGTRPMLAGHANPLARIQELLAQRASAYSHADVTIDTSDLTVDDVVNRISQTLSPCLCKSWEYFCDHAGELSQRYGGKYVVVAKNSIVASGATQLEAYHGIPARIAQQADVGIYYIPLPEESLTAL